jgi:hypothetical protein
MICKTVVVKEEAFLVSSHHILMLLILMLMFGKGLGAAAPKSGVEVRGACGIAKAVP